MRVFLIGFMASGKSSAGKKLAKKIDLPFVDLDDYIEEKYNSTIRLLIYEKGIDTFREIEKNSLDELIHKYKDVLISTGGGTPCFFNNMELMNSKGVTIYLEVDIPTLVDRLIHSKKDRPLIWGKTRDDLTVYAKDLLAKRHDFYSKAQHKVNGKNLKIESLVELIK
ncbi:MAG: shikimate kinase [Marinilabiliales bacterium]|nr:MAG: shikimate kinase [Marinilabiliales bacterium]